MKRDTGALIKGMAMGAVVGSAIGYISSTGMSKQSRKIKRNASKAIHTVNSFLNNVSGMMK